MLVMLGLKHTQIMWLGVESFGWILLNWTQTGLGALRSPLILDFDLG